MQTYSNRHLKLSCVLTFIVLGFLESSWAPMVPYVKARFALDEFSLGLLLICTGIGSFTALPVISMLVGRYGCRLIASLSALILASCLVLLSVVSQLYLCALLLFGFGAATIGIDVAVNVNAVIVEAKLRRPLMSGFHGGYSLGALLGSATVSFMLTLGLSLFTNVSCVFVLMLTTIFWCGRALVSASEVKAYEAEQPKPDAPQNRPQGGLLMRLLQVPRLIVLVGISCFIMYAIEGSIMSWSGVFATQERQMSLERAGFIFSAFAIAMTLMRFMGNRIVLMLGRRRTVMLGTLFVALGYGITVAIPHVYGTVLGFMCIGFGAANIVPQWVSFAGGVKGYPVHDTIAFINALGYSGLLIGPVLIGFFAELFSLSAVFVGIGACALVVGLMADRIIKDETYAA
ncbi:MAG: MFS transporter [Succinivibrio sp.]|nr:MFS transporter [Succinivibrio sp.]